MGELMRDPAFNIVPKNSTFFIIWRVENLELVALKREDYGKFHRGDSYLVLGGTEYGKPAGMEDIPHPPRGRLDIHIHFWLGSETSTDEAGVAAIKCVELDNMLGGGPVQHREAEGSESKRFLSYFKNGMRRVVMEVIELCPSRLLRGGVATGFRKVTDDFQPSLYHVKGKRSTVVKELHKIEWEAMNDGDVYILDTRSIIYVWVGRNSNNIEKLQAAKFASTLKQEHGGGTIVMVEDGQEAALQDRERLAFEELLPLNNKQVTPASEAPKDETVARRISHELKLFRCTDESGTLKVAEVKNGPLLHADLNTNDSFIIDNGQDGIWVWVGKKATQKEREEALRNAQGFITKKGYPPHTQVSRIVQHGEPPEFKTLFKDWRDKDQTIGFGRQFSTSKIATTVQTKFDAVTLHMRPELAAKTQMVDDGKGQKEVWRIKNFNLIPVPENQYGEFFMGDCYIVLYAYLEGAAERYILYYWIGDHASKDEAGTAALKAVELDDRLEGRAVQVRTVQGKEPPHFMAVFGGKMVIFEGGFASSFDGSGARDQGRKSSYMLQVRGSTNHNTKAIEVDMRAGCLNSNDCFVVATPQLTYVWCGKGSTGDEREMAKSLGASKGETLMVSEGLEKEDFWHVLGGKAKYASSSRLREEEPTHPPRLFQCSNASGVFKAEELINFSQADLMDDDVMLLDSWDTIFLWAGCHANKVEQRSAEAMAIEYLRTDPAGRKDIPIIKIKQGFEPPNFTGFFGVWDNDLWNDNMTYADICERLEEAAPGATVLVTSSFSSGSSKGKRTYPIAILKVKDAEKLPPEVDPKNKEDFLSEGDFKTVFGCCPREYLTDFDARGTSHVSKIMTDSSRTPWSHVPSNDTNYSSDLHWQRPEHFCTFT
ncbi:Advillin [Chionoecetes opilio]|uniref:Advillin n=1 Tax=Chionoecetes opilio TaxID=41210 RepID=A0A8J4YCL3_CHIOP|nr:Advillin [Chionoecetes opilio]